MELTMSLAGLFSLLDKLIKLAIAIALVLMVGFVFTNVVLRYAFDSGLTWSSEVARYLFVWVVFLGSILAVADHSHLGVDILVSRVPLWLQKVLFVLSVILITGVMTLVVRGLLMLIELNVGITGPATELPINNYYYAGMVSAVLMSLVLIFQAVSFALTGRHGPQWSQPRDGSAEP
ncbi:TRAP transporter small permease [Kushneria phosphatilytica]|uniref:TRAP transporter small permease protein n=2 Tax=Kushneria phosphatilytica TaxID=657387 RepID=A0A5C0ZVT3_9GAMM|nr:TRAP transporter small permease [Kushneria phosphatilytica]